MAPRGSIDGPLTITGDLAVAGGLTVDGVTIDDSTLAVNDLTASAAEINQALDGIGADVTAENLDELTGGEDTELHTHVLEFGASDVTASAAELNKLDGAGAVVASGTQAAHIDDPTGAATDQDDEARTAIASILAALEAFGIVAAS